MNTHRFTPTTFFIWSTLLIWMANFLFVYVFAALACARQFADVRLLRVGIVPFTVVASCLLAGVATGVVIWMARRRGARDPRSDEHSNFIRFVVIATGILALVGTLYVLLPPLLLRAHCAGGA